MKIHLLAASCIIGCVALPARADWEAVQKIFFLDGLESSGSHTRIMASPYTLHYSPSPNHRPTWMFGAERQYGNGTLFGAAYFSNSFGQDSATIYRGGRIKNLTSYEPLYVQWTAGLMYGYKEPYADDVPLNFKGFSPLVVLAVGWQLTPRYSVQINALGTAALMLQFAVDLP